MNERQCVVCGKPFTPVTWNNIFCKPECHRMEFLRHVKKVSTPNEFKNFIEESHPEKKVVA